MNELTTTTSVDLTLEQCDDLLVSGIHSVRDAILGYTKLGLTQPQISNRVAELGFKASVRTIKRHVSDLRAEGLLPAVGESERSQRRHRAERPKGQNGLMADPVTQVTTDTQPSTNHVPIEPEPEPVLVSAVVVGDERDPERDYARALECIDELLTITKQYFHSGWDKRKWFELAGECRTIEACCNAHCGSKYGQGAK